MQYAGAAGPGSWRGRGRRGWPLCLRREGERLKMIRNCSGKLEKAGLGFLSLFLSFIPNKTSCILLVNFQ